MGGEGNVSFGVNFSLGTIAGGSSLLCLLASLCMCKHARFETTFRTYSSLPLDCPFSPSPPNASRS